MNETLSMILTWFSPLAAWLPLSGRDKEREPSVAGRPESYLMMGAAAAVPAGLLRLVMFTAPVKPPYGIAADFFRGLAVDGILGILLPLTALLFSYRLTSRPRDGRTAAARASLIILAYCVVEGFFSTESGAGFQALPDSLLRSAPKLAMAPLWGYLLTAPMNRDTRYMYITASAVFGMLFSGSAAFLLGINHAGAASVPSLIAFSAALGLRYGAVENLAASDPINPDDSITPIDPDRPAERARSGRLVTHSVYSLMKEGRYREARLDADIYLQRHTDLLVFCWQALLRWLGGDRAYRTIFLYRYKALSGTQRRRFKHRMDECLGEYSPIVALWIRTIEDLEENREPAS